MAESQSRSEPQGIYVASRVKHADMWKRHRAEGAPIISTWIDEAGEGDTPDFGELWARIRKEIASCRALVFYGTADDAPWKGAFVEVGMALAMGKRVYLVYPDKLDGRTQRPLGSWILDHDNVIRVPFVEVALWRVNADNIPAPRSERGHMLTTEEGPAPSKYVMYRLNGKPYRICDCDPHKGPCKLGAERTLLTCELSRCILPEPDERNGT